MEDKITIQKITCHHCGEICADQKHSRDKYTFCCNGCYIVHGILKDARLLNYYRLSSAPGSKGALEIDTNYDFLDAEDVISKLLHFKNDSYAKVSFNLPQIHCSSCLYLLENLNRIDENIISSNVNFITKQATITFDYQSLSLRNLVEVLSRIGYPPLLTHESLDQSTKHANNNHKLYYQLGIAGFSFANIMLLSFPDYLGLHNASSYLFIGYINIALALPVLIYCARDYLVSAWNSVYYHHPNIDVPIAIGILTLFIRSVYEILAGAGEGYLDSFSGFIFFLLIGKWFQGFTHRALDFDRTYKSYFPISALTKDQDKWIAKPLDKIEKADIVMIRNEEVVPTDGILQSDIANIDYSFVTGESTTLSIMKGDKIYAGGRQIGQSIQLKVTAETARSKLIQLWNEDVFQDKTDSSTSRLINIISKYFTYVIFGVALCTLAYWLWYDPSKAFNATTAVLIVACPCALALTIPFTYGSILRYLAAHGLFLRNTNTLEKIQSIDSIIFDKTGTLTNNKLTTVEYRGVELSGHDKSLLRSSCMQSKHPLSIAIQRYFSSNATIPITSFQEIVGKGIEAKTKNDTIRIGSSKFIFGSSEESKKGSVFIKINDEYLGYFEFSYEVRRGLQDVIKSLQGSYWLALLSGDNDLESDKFHELFNNKSEIHFNQQPKDKLDFIKKLQSKKSEVMMIGDGLNDAGALKQSNVGLVLSEDTNNFSPACDGILQTDKFQMIPTFIALITKSRYIIYGAFILALLYNVIGLYFAVTAQLSPIVAAILMPISSISIILYGTLSSYLLVKTMLK